MFCICRATSIKVDAGQVITTTAALQTSQGIATVHPGFKKNYMIHDIALVRLLTPFTLNCKHLHPRSHLILTENFSISKRGSDQTCQERLPWNRIELCNCANNGLRSARQQYVQLNLIFFSFLSINRQKNIQFTNFFTNKSVLFSTLHLKSIYWRQEDDFHTLHRVHFE